MAMHTFVFFLTLAYTQDSASKIENIRRMLAAAPPHEPDYAELDQLVHQFKGSSASLGAKALTHLCVQLRSACGEHNRQGCALIAQQMEEAYQVLRVKLQELMAADAARRAS